MAIRPIKKYDKLFKTKSSALKAKRKHPKKFSFFIDKKPVGKGSVKIGIKKVKSGWRLKVK